MAIVAMTRTVRLTSPMADLPFRSKPLGSLDELALANVQSI